MKFYELAQFSLTMSHLLVHRMDGVYLMSNYSGFCFTHEDSVFIYCGEVKLILKAELLIFL